MNKNNRTELCYYLTIDNRYSSSDYFYVYVIVYEQFAKIYFKDWHLNDHKISGSEKEIIDGIFLGILSYNQLNTIEHVVLHFLN